MNQTPIPSIPSIPSSPQTQAPSVSGSVSGSGREGKQLIDATRPFAQEERLKSWAGLALTLMVAAVLWLLAAGPAGPFARAFAYLAPATAVQLGIRLGASVVLGLTVVRLFIYYHDYLHGALLRGSPVAKALMSTYGVLVMAPPRVWKETHNYHHAHTAKIVGSHVGSYAMVTPLIWAKMKPKDRFMYKVIRHPLTILFGVFTIFMFGMGVSPLLRSPKKNWDSAVSLVVFWGLAVVLIAKFGLFTWLLVHLVPLFVACSTGSYLFYAQHNFPDIHVQPREEWSYTRAALESSSYMKVGPVMAWFTGNIGYHHVHHLNQQIPFYRLPEAMAAIPELQNPPTTSLSLRDMVRNFRLKLWDPTAAKMTGYPS